MFVVSIRAGKKQVLTVLGVIVGILVIGVALLSGGETVEVAAGIQTTAKTAEERLAFLRQFGWETGTEPVEIYEIVVPEVFNEVYTQYNELQKVQGFDLSRYAGKRVKRWTYEVMNYPEYEGTVYANLLILDGKVVGGDLSAAEQNGFVRGFAPDSGMMQESAPEVQNGLNGAKEGSFEGKNAASA